VREIIINCSTIPEQRQSLKFLSNVDIGDCYHLKAHRRSQQQKKSLMQQLLTGKKRFAGSSEEMGTFYSFGKFGFYCIKKSIGQKHTPIDFFFQYISYQVSAGGNKQ